MKEELEKYLIETGTATEKEIELVTNINGYTLETLQDILWVRTGYRNLNQIEEMEGE